MVKDISSIDCQFSKIREKSSSPLLLSVCIPAYNRPEWLKRSILSILSISKSFQQQVEIIISDDSTTSECQTVVHDLLSTWKGVWKYARNSPSLGMAANWNRSIQIASGKYVLVLHDDDYLETNALDLIIDKIQIFSDTHYALLFGVNVVTRSQQIIKQQAFRTQIHLKAERALERVLADSSFVRFPGIVLKKEVFNHLGYFNETIGGIADIEMWIRIFCQYDLLCLPIVTANYTVHDNALTMSMFNLSTIKRLEVLFNIIVSQNILSEKIVEICKANYFHQFILAGTVRYVKRGEFDKAKKTFSLFKNAYICNEQARWRWQAIRTILKIVLKAHSLLRSSLRKM